MCLMWSQRTIPSSAHEHHLSISTSWQFVLALTSVDLTTSLIVHSGRAFPNCRWKPGLVESEFQIATAADGGAPEYIDYLVAQTLIVEQDVCKKPPL